MTTRRDLLKFLLLYIAGKLLIMVQPFLFNFIHFEILLIPILLINITLLATGMVGLYITISNILVASVFGRPIITRIPGPFK